jgi:hypothetical protein
MGALAGDNLTIVLFFVGLSVTLGSTAMSQSGWKHWGLIALLWALSAMSLLVGIGWTQFKAYSPAVESIVVSVATSPISWFVVIMCALMTALLHKRPGIFPATVGKETLTQPKPSPIQNKRNLDSISDDDLMGSVLQFCLSAKASDLATSSRISLIQAKIRGAQGGRGKIQSGETLEGLQKALAEYQAKRLAEFNRKFADRAIRLKTELARRTSRAIGGSEDPTVDLLDKHILNDRSVSEMCDYFTELADQLPSLSTRY